MGSRPRGGWWGRQGEAWRSLWAAGVLVHHALAVGVQPDHLAAKGGGPVEQRGFSRDRQPQAGAHEVRAEACREGWMRHHASDVGHHVVG